MHDTQKQIQGTPYSDKLGKVRRTLANVTMLALCGGTYNLFNLDIVVQVVHVES